MSSWVLLGNHLGFRNSIDLVGSVLPLSLEFHTISNFIYAVVEVDLLADHFRPGKQNYDHVKWSFEERLGDSVHFVLCHSAAGIVALC